MATKITTAAQAWRRVRFLEKEITCMKRTVEYYAHRRETLTFTSADEFDARRYTERKIARYRKEASDLLARLIRIPTHSQQKGLYAR